MTAGIRPRGRVVKILGVVLIVLGLVATATGVSKVVSKVGSAVVDSFSGPVYTVPIQATFTAHQGTNLIMQESAYRNNAFTNFPVAAIRPDDVDLTDPNGAPVVPTATNTNYSISRNSDSFFEIMQFHADTPGQYHLAIFAPVGLRLIVVPSLTEPFSHAAGWFAAAGLGILLIIGGAILLIVGFVQSGKAKRADQPLYGGYGAYAPPPGWYPDPSNQGSTRWWDGTRWQP